MHPLRWKAQPSASRPATSANNVTANESVFREVFGDDERPAVQPVAAAAHAKPLPSPVADDNMLFNGPTLSGPQNSNSSAALEVSPPALFTPPSVVKEVPTPAMPQPRSASKHLGGWNKAKIDEQVKQASAVDPFGEAFPEQLAQAPANPRSAFPGGNLDGGAFQPGPQAPPQFNQPLDTPPADPLPPPADSLPGFNPAPNAVPGVEPMPDEFPPASQLRNPRRGNGDTPETPRPRSRYEVDPAPLNQPERDPMPPAGTPEMEPNTPPEFAPNNPPPRGFDENPRSQSDRREPKDPKKSPDDCFQNERDCCKDAEECKLNLTRVRNASIKNISLDITPRFNPAAESWAADREARDKELTNTKSRQWKDREGNVLASGRMVDLAQGKVLVDVGGSVQRLPFGMLSEADLCFVNAWWKLPTECLIGGDPYSGRNWEPASFTWTASCLCHKTLYFDDTQLERYGHTAGPVLQPLLSGAHFFGDVIFFPYNAGINPPQECHYALGYYRPGNCAPWVIPPFPLSARGALLQAGVVVGGLYLIP